MPLPVNLSALAMRFSRTLVQAKCVAFNVVRNIGVRMIGQGESFFLRAVEEELNGAVDDLVHVKRGPLELRLPASMREKSNRSVTRPNRVWLGLAHISA